MDKNAQQKASEEHEREEQQPPVGLTVALTP